MTTHRLRLGRTSTRSRARRTSLARRTRVRRVCGCMNGYLSVALCGSLCLSMPFCGHLFISVSLLPLSISLLLFLTQLQCAGGPGGEPHVTHWTAHRGRCQVLWMRREPRMDLCRRGRLSILVPTSCCMCVVNRLVVDAYPCPSLPCRIDM